MCRQEPPAQPPELPGATMSCMSGRTYRLAQVSVQLRLHFPDVVTV